MILVFGGTTEGLKAVKALEEAGSPYFYSTRGTEQSVIMSYGTRLCGAMDAGGMTCFCRDNGIRLIVDAAHPFAALLHDTVATVASALDIPAVRFERIFPERDTERIEWCDGYDDAIERLSGCRCVIATTGVQSIGRLAVLKSRGVRLYHRILNRESSLIIARRLGATADELCFYGEGETNSGLFARLRPDAILVKESGETGGFAEKVSTAIDLGVRVVAIKRPETPPSFVVVNGEHGLRRAVERLLPGFYPLRSGLTTGTCATAAALAAAIRLLRGDTPPAVPVILPNGETIEVDVIYGGGYAAVIKDSGDDPDVTDGMEIRAAVVSWSGEFGAGSADSDIKDCYTQKHISLPAPHSPLHEKNVLITISSGPGVGTVTLPGFDFPPGSPAINRVPREMIRNNIMALLHPDVPLTVTVSVPGGEEIAARTFNPRLGIVGGISIVGVSGIIKPFSKDSFVGSIRKCMQVAVASGAERVVINSGAKSERFVRAIYPELPPQAFVEYGNYIGDTISIAAELGVARLTLGVMIGKAVKLAAGRLDTHSRQATMDKDFIASMLAEAGCTAGVISAARGITLARELWTIVPQERLGDFCRVVISHCMDYCRPLLPDGELTVLLIDESGRCFSA